MRIALIALMLLMVGCASAPPRTVVKTEAIRQSVSTQLQIEAALTEQVMIQIKDLELARGTNNAANVLINSCQIALREANTRLQVISERYGEKGGND